MKNADQPINPIFDAEGFPSEDIALKQESLIGLTKREYFAAKAMQGFLSNPKMGYAPSRDRSIVFNAVLMADQLLEELEKNKP